MPTVLTQENYQQAVQGNWDGPYGIKKFILDMLNYGDRAIAGPNNQGFSSYAQILADVQARGLDTTGMPSVAEAEKMAGYTANGSPGSTVYVGDTGSAAPTPIDNTKAPTPVNVPLDPNQVAGYRRLASFLDSVGLGYLATFDGDKPGGWLWDEIVSKGYTDDTEIQQALDENADWRERFAPMYEQRELAKQGKPVQIMTPAEIRAYEMQGANLMRSANMPPDLYNDYKDFQQLMVRGVSMQQLEKATTESWNRVANAAPEVRNYFAEAFGPSGDSALASFFLDNAQFDQKLDQMSRTASIGGTARSLGVNLGVGTSTDLAKMGLEGESARQGLLNVASMKNLFNENFNEQQDLTSEQGARAVFGLDAQDALRIQQRRDQRTAAFAGGGGGALTSQGLLSSRVGV